MKVRRFLNWFYEWINNYNLFIPDENDYDDNDERKDPATKVKRQKYATRLYMPLLILTLYVLFFVALIIPQNRIITISNITPALFNQLRLQHSETLSCPCSTTTVPYKNFVSTTISFHPVCSSVFVSQQWIDALYLPYASAFLVMDFRTTAHAQFKLLAGLCSICKETICQALNDFDNSQFISLQLLEEDEIPLRTYGLVELLQTYLPIQIISPLNFLQMITRSNFFISALNTNVFIEILTTVDKRHYLSISPTYYFKKSLYKGDAILSSPCHLKGPTTPAGFYSLSSYESALNHQIWPENPPLFEPNASSIVDGFFGGCTPLDALLTSTLDCLYSIDCLGHFPEYFPNLNQINFDWTNIILTSSNRKNISLNDHLSNLLVEDWSIKINYSNYFNSCAPSFCTYVEKDQTNFSYTIALLISLYGGLTIILRAIAVFLVNVSSKIQSHFLIIPVDPVHYVSLIKKCTRWIKQLNLFKSAKNRTADDIKKQRIMTYTYLILLASSIFILLMFTSLITRTITVTESNPSLTTYRQLQDVHRNTLKCSCTNVSLRYDTFSSLSATLHQVCSSDLIDQAWLAWLGYLDGNSFDVNTDSWPGLGRKHFQLLSVICQLANRTVDDAIHRFYMQSFITSNVFVESDFHEQLNSIFSQFNQSLIIQFSRLVDTVKLFTEVDQPYTTFDNAKLIFNNRTNQTKDKQALELKFNFTGVKNMNSNTIDCICATDPKCHSPVVADQWTTTFNGDSYVPAPYVVPGMKMGCFTFDSLLLSTLECYYQADCLLVQYSYLNRTRDIIDTEMNPFYIHPLIYNAALTRFTRDTPLSVIIKEMMIEQFNASFSFDRYYEACKPNYCTYSYLTRTVSFIELIVKLVSTIGGLTIALRLITPQLVKIVLYLLQLKIRRQIQANSTIINRIKAIYHRLMILTYTAIDNFNLFKGNRFGNRCDQTEAKHIGVLATRLFIVLFIIGFVILALYTVIRPETLTNTFDNPSLSMYHQLMHTHSDTLQCPCSSISSTYERFIKIEPVFHAICSSIFVSDQWRMNLTAHLVPDLSIYAVRDYRRFITSHLQFLSGLCQISMQSINDSINQFLSSFFVTPQLLSPTNFYQRIESLINQSRSNAPVIFTRLVSLLRTTNHGNAIVSAYGTNFEYINPWYNLSTAIALTQVMNYNDNCSCALNATCAIQSHFIETNSFEIVPIKGFKMGCTPSESFLASTLECFYDISCINLIQKHIIGIDRSNTTNVSSLLNVNISRFPVNTLIIDLVENLFFEKWLTNISYSAYFHQCSPTYCSYTYIQKLNSIYTVMVLLGLCGGLKLVLAWICPNVIYLLFKLYHYWKKRNNRIKPACTFTITASEDANRTLENKDVPTIIIDSISSSMSCSAFLRCFIFSFIVFILMIAGVIVTTVYFQYQKKQYISSTTLLSTATISTTTGTIVSTMTFSTSTVPTCQLTFQPLVSYNTRPNSKPASVAVGDFNDDSHLDLVVANYGTASIGILLGQRNGTFGPQTTFPIGDDGYPNFVAVSDFNNDNRLDLAVAILGTGHIGVMLGKGNGSFGASIILSTGPTSFPSALVVGDFNNDGQNDLAAANTKAMNIGVLLGNGNETFGVETTFSFGTAGYPKSIATCDFNNDGLLDLAVANGELDNVAVLLNNGNGYFGMSMVFSTGTFSFPKAIAVADFNRDNRLDMAIANFGKDNIGIMLGNNDGTFAAQMTFSTEVYSYPSSIAVQDFNYDGQLDIAVTNSYAHNVGLLLGIGNGSFLKQMTFTTGARSTPVAITSADLNNDGKLDLAITDNTLNSVGILLNTCNCCVP